MEKDILFHLSYKGAVVVLNAEQLTAAFLTKLRDILAANSLNSSEAVLSVPDYYTQIERKCLLEAARIAGLNVPRLISESAALGISYGLFRKADLTEVPRNVLIIDFGHGKLSASVTAFTKEKMTALLSLSDRNLGTRQFDISLLSFYRDKLLKTKNLDFFSSKKAVMRCFEAVEKQRKMLSANSEAMINLEYFIEEEDLNYLMNRKEFEEIIAPVLLSIRNFLVGLKEEIVRRKL